MEIQRGLYSIFGDTVEQRIIINGYDDGKSTGAVRRVYNDKILGPSDLRKNQVFRHQLQNGGQETDLSRFLNHRFHAPDAVSAKKVVLSLLQVLDDIRAETYQLFYKHIESFFEVALIETYTDFNVGNIIYSSLFAELGTAPAITCMEEVLGIPRGHVLYQSNEALNLSATTAMGKTLVDEASIVDFGDETDEIVAVHLQNVPRLLDEVVEIVKRSDMIIFSCGTLWSSHIPTFMSEGFLDLVGSTRCDKYIIMNLTPDKDVLGVSDEGYVKLLERYLPLDTTMVYAHGGRIRPPPKLRHPHLVLGREVINSCGRKHDGVRLCMTLMRHHYRRMCQFTHHVFDYDYTLYVPGLLGFNDEMFSEWSAYRRRKTILTRNDIRHVGERWHACDLYAHFGVWRRDVGYMDPYLCLSPEEKGAVYSVLSSELTTQATLSPTTIEDRGVTICVKPIPEERRQQLTAKLTRKWVPLSLRCIATGRTSIEIMKCSLTKNMGYQWVQQNNPCESLFYISDEDDIPQIPEDKKWIVREPRSLLAYLKWHNLLSKEYLPDLFIVAGGKNTRNDGNVKLLTPFHQGGVTCVMDLVLKNARPYVRHIYVLTTCREHTDKIRSWVSLREEEPDVSIVCGWDGPTSGSLETLYMGLLHVGVEKCSTQSLVMWSDCILPDARLVCELSHMYGTFIVPTEYVSNPYAYVVEKQDAPGVVDQIKLRSDAAVECGYHDLSIFNVQVHSLLPIMAAASINKKEDGVRREQSLFDVIPHLRDKCTFYESQYPTYSFNSRTELEAIQAFLSLQDK